MMEKGDVLVAVGGMYRLSGRDDEEGKTGHERQDLTLPRRKMRMPNTSRNLMQDHYTMNSISLMSTRSTEKAAFGIPQAGSYE